jgi:hypothetical protein
VRGTTSKLREGTSLRRRSGANSPPPIDSAAYAADFAEFAATGGVASSERMGDPVSSFWRDFSDIGWNRITRAAAKAKDLHLWQSARLFVLVNVAMADSYIAQQRRMPNRVSTPVFTSTLPQRQG